MDNNYMLSAIAFVVFMTTFVFGMDQCDPTVKWLVTSILVYIGSILISCAWTRNQSGLLWQACFWAGNFTGVGSVVLFLTILWR